MKKVNPSGQIIQDTGSGGAWPVSDRPNGVAPWRHTRYIKVTGDRKWLETVYPIAVRSLEKDEKTVMSQRGLVRGETSLSTGASRAILAGCRPSIYRRARQWSTNVMYAPPR